MHTFAHTHKRILNSCYLYPIHAGLHLQLLYSFPGLGDAGCAVVGDTVLHGAPVTPSRSTKGGHTESVNITLNPEAAAAPLAMSLTPLEQAILCHNPFFLFKEPILSEGICFTAAKLHFIWRKKGLMGAAGQCHFSVSVHAWSVFFSPLREFLLFFTSAGWERSYKRREH